MTKSPNLWRLSALVAGATLLYKLLGFAEKLVLAHVFGTSATADAYIAGASVVLLVGFLLADIASPAMIPVLLADPAGARRTFGSTLGWVLLGAVPLATLGWWGAGGLARVFGPGFDAPTQALTASIIRVGMVALPALCATAILTAWYQAHGHFIRPALADIALKLGPLAGIAVLGGVQGLAWGLMLGALVRLLLLLSRRVPLRPRLASRDAGLRMVVHGAWPLLLTALVSVHLIGVIETALASTLGTGAVAALAYARRIVDVPIILAPQVLARVAFPMLTELAIRQDRAALAVLLQRCVRISMLLLLPLTIVGTLLSTALVRLLFERGAFDARSVGPTSTAMMTILPGLPALALSILLVRFNYATGDTRRPSIIRVAGAVLQIGLALWWRRWGLAGLGWATTVSLWAETIALVSIARSAIHAPRDRDWRFWLRLLVAGLSCGAAVILGRSVWPEPDGTGPLFGYLAALTLLGCGAYAAVLVVGQVGAVRAGWALLRRRGRAGEQEAAG
ncbi:MAG: oligosaccharide flippase family protein [Herpetosiphonaceae bacterium]|nr:oligosaccharide flippase family protein [Herpetosiphonaceae bacterium]